MFGEIKLYIKFAWTSRSHQWHLVIQSTISCLTACKVIDVAGDGLILRGSFVVDLYETLGTVMFLSLINVQKNFQFKTMCKSHKSG